MFSVPTPMRIMAAAVGAAAVVVILASEPSTSLPGPEIAGSSIPAAPLLRVVAPSQIMTAGDVSPYGEGFERELLESYARGAGFDVVWQTGEDAREAWAAVESGRADLAIGFGFQAPDSLDSLVQAGPEYVRHQPVVVYNNGNTDRDLRRGDVDLCSVPVMVSADLEEFDMDIADLQDCRITADVEPVALEPMLDSLNHEESGAMVVEEGRFRLMQPFFKELRLGGEVADTISYRWIWRSDDERLATTMESFWEYQADSPQMEELKERYFGFLPKKTDYYELSHISEVLEEALPTYSEAISAAAHEYGIDPLLLTAVIYQESRFNSGAVSSTGVRGLMQITSATARHLGIDRTDPFQSIDGGARYLRELYDSLEKYDLSEWDRWFLALAAYNQGPGHLKDAMRLSRMLGGEGRSWKDVKEAFPLLSREKYYSQVRHGYCRGREAVNYVDNIRYFYYILNGFVVLSRPESQHLGTLLGIVSNGWPGV